MNGGTPRYAARAVEGALVARIEYLLAQTGDMTPRVLVLLGAAGDGARSMLLHGIVPRLTATTAQVHGDWHPDATVQVCASASDVPDAPPDAGSGIRVVLCAAHSLPTLPGWVTARRPPDVFTVGPLAWGELGDFLAARAGGPVEAGSAAALARAAGFVPAVLARLVDSLLAVGRLDVVDGLWQLRGDVHSDDARRALEAWIDVLPDAHRELLHTIALAEPMRMPSNRAAIDSLIAGGIVERVAGDRVAFRAPVIAELARRSAPEELASRVHLRSLARGPVAPQALFWAADRGSPVAERVVADAVERAIERRDGATALRLVEAALELAERVDGVDVSPASTAWLHLRGADAARRLPDADRAADHLAAAADLIRPLALDHPLQLELAASAAEVNGYVHGDTDAALRALRACAPPDARARADLGAREYLQLVTAAWLDEADELAARHGGDFRGARWELRSRARLAGHVALVARGRPHAALRKIVPVLTRQTLSLRPHPEVVAEAQIAYVVAALGSDGPAAFPTLARQLDARHEDGYQPDVVGFTCTRAMWVLARGDVAEARRIAVPALGASEHADPSGTGPLLTALLASCSALLGDRDSALVLRDRLAMLPPRASRMARGALDAHRVVTAFSLGDDGSELAREAADAHLELGHLGFAAEVLHAAVRFGDVEAARMLLALDGELDGNLHHLRLAHARALLAADPIGLVEAARGFDAAGLVLHAAEAACQARSIGDPPASLERRARSYLALVPALEGLRGHPLLASATSERAAAAADAPLSPRESEILRLIEAGLSNADIAATLHLSLRTVEGHITRLYRKRRGARRAPLRRPGA